MPVVDSSVVNPSGAVVSCTTSVVLKGVTYTDTLEGLSGVIGDCLRVVSLVSV